MDVSVIYCEDIRHELGGKVSFLGVFTASLLVATFPAVIPRFAIRVLVEDEVSKEGKDFQLELRLGDVLIASLAPENSPMPNVAGHDGLSIAVFEFALNGLYVDAPTSVQILIKDGEKLLQMRPFKILKLFDKDVPSEILPSPASTV